MAIYEVAFLLGKTVRELRSGMPLNELQGWFNFFERRPAGWREDQRTAMLLQAAGVKESGPTLFPSLASMKAANHLNFKGSHMQKMLLGSKGGVTLPFLQ